MARQYAKTPVVRRTILEACLSAFGESGFHGATMADIARRAGISYTGLLHHFPRKENLLTAVLALQDERSATYLREHGTFSPGADPADVLRGLVATLVETGRERGLVELSTTLTGEATSPQHPAHAHFADRYRDTRSFLTRLFGDLSERGRIAVPTPPAELAAMTIALTEGLQTQQLYDGSIPVTGILRSFLDTVIRDEPR